jgi:hypothetical protein
MKLKCIDFGMKVMFWQVSMYSQRADRLERQKYFELSRPGKMLDCDSMP